MLIGSYRSSDSGFEAIKCNMEGNFRAFPGETWLTRVLLYHLKQSSLPLGLMSRYKSNSRANCQIKQTQLMPYNDKVVHHLEPLLDWLRVIWDEEELVGERERVRERPHFIWQYTGTKGVCPGGDTSKSPCFHKDFFTLLNTMGILRATAITVSHEKLTTNLWKWRKSPKAISLDFSRVWEKLG